MGISEAIVLEEVSKYFGSFVALQRVELHLPSGCFLLLIGPNGAGKSTLLRLLAGLCRPSQGRVLVWGANPHTSAAARATIGLISHQTLLYEDLTARENLLFFARLYGLTHPEERVDRALKEVDLYPRQAYRVRTFSRGMKQRLTLARAILHQPTVLLFDEPFTGLDQVAVQTLSRHLFRFKEQGCTGILVTHQLEPTIGLIDYLMVLRGGRVCYRGSWAGGSLEELSALYTTCLDGSP